LSKGTGLTRKQIQNWFTNSRKRFLEPLKKKIEDKKSNDTSPHNAEVLDQPANPEQKPNLLPQIPIDPTNVQQGPQVKTFPQFSPTFPNINDPNVMKPVVPQQLSMIPIQTQNQAFMYPGMIPAGALQNGNNILLVPCFVPQPTMSYSYRPPNMVPLNASFIQLPQGNIPMGEQSAMIPNSYVGHPCFMPLQPNIMDVRNVGQNLATNYNTINNNVYNSINNLGTMGMGNNGPMGNVGNMGGLNTFNVIGYSNMPVANVAYMNNMDPNFGRILDKTSSGIKPNQNELFSTIYEGGNISQMSAQRNIGGINHPRPEIDEYQGQKRLHKDYLPGNNTN
jgi:hypothetical protein